MLFLSMLFLPAFAQAAEPQASVRLLGQANVYLKDFDVLALDVDIQANQGDMLESLTMTPSGNARFLIEYGNLTLWRDRGVEGFQGWGYDEQLVFGTQSNGGFVFENIDADFDSASERFFVSFETSLRLEERTLQFNLDAPNDLNGDGQWQSGEKGIFLSGQTVPIISTSSSSLLFRFKALVTDFLGPKGAIDATLSVDAASATVYVEPSLPLVFTGKAKDRNGDSVSSVEVLLGETAVWATQTSSQFATWRAEYTPVDVYENHEVRLRFADGGNREFTTEPFYIRIDTRVPDQFRSELLTSRTIIAPNGLEIADLALWLRDKDGNALPQRTIQFMPVREGDILSVTQGQTDANGRLLTNLISEMAGTAEVQARYKGQVIATVFITVNEEGEAPEGPVLFPGNLMVGNLVKGSLSAVYYLAGDGKRHVFVNDRVYATWYGTNFSSVLTIPDSMLAAIPLGSPVTFRPGTMLKAPSVPAVYVVDVNQTLRHISSEPIATQLFGVQWNTMVHDLEESLLFSYRIGEPILDASAFGLDEIRSLPLTINSEIVS